MFWLACFSDYFHRGSFANIVIEINNLFGMSFYPQMALDQLSFWGSCDTQSPAQSHPEEIDDLSFSVLKDYL